MPQLTSDPIQPIRKPISNEDVSLKGSSWATAHSQNTDNPQSLWRPPSPVAPPYSPITPKVQPALPVPNIQAETGELGRQDVSLGSSVVDATMSAGNGWKGPYVQDVLPPQPYTQPTQVQANNHPSLHTAPFSGRLDIHPGAQPLQHDLPRSLAPTQEAHPTPANRSTNIPSHTVPRSSTFESSIPESTYIPQPAPIPFSSEDSTDAIALRAAISALQFQKKKAEDDVRNLQDLKKQALGDPRRFQTELAAGRLKEQRPTMGDMQAILDASDSDSEEEGSERNTKSPSDKEKIAASSQTSSNQNSADSSKSSDNPQDAKHTPPPFSRIPGPQNIVRMPPVNWDKYHIVGEPLDALHEQQRRWPGSAPFGLDKGREHSVAAPYSPFYDILADDQNSSAGSGLDGGRKDGRLPSLTSAMSSQAGGTVSEHPMETRRGGARH